MTDLAPVKAIYYPYIEFGSVPWLKAALLYWEGVRRIVPSGYVPNDPPEVRQLVEAKLIEDTPAKDYREPAAEVFLERLEALGSMRSGRRPGVLNELGPTSERIHVEKMESNLLLKLQGMGLAESVGQSVAMSPEMAGLYMITLANEAGYKLHSPPITDRASYDAAATYFAHRQVTRDHGAVSPTDGFACARLLLPFPSPTAVANLPVEELIKLRAKYERERGDFREKVQASVEAIAAMPSIEAVRDHLNDFTAKVEHEVEARRDALRAANVTAAWTLLGISVPTSISVGLAGAATAAGAPLVATVAGVGAVALGVTSWFMQRRQERKAGGHYLLSLQDALGTNAAGELDHSLRQLVLE